MSSPPNTRQVVAAALRAAREASNYSQSELAEKLGVSRRAIQIWESGTRLPHPRHRRLILAFIAEVEDGQAA